MISVKIHKKYSAFVFYFTLPLCTLNIPVRNIERFFDELPKLYSVFTKEYEVIKKLYTIGCSPPRRRWGGGAVYLHTQVAVHHVEAGEEGVD